MSSKRGYIIAVALVTKRIKPLTVDGKKVQTVGVRCTGLQGSDEARLSRQYPDSVRGDGNSYTPEFKSFLVKVEKA